MKATAAELAVRFNATVSLIHRWARIEGCPHEMEKGPRGKKELRVFDVEEVEEWAANNNKQVTFSDRPELSDATVRNLSGTRRNASPEADAVAALLAANVERGEGSTLSERAAAEVLSIYARLQLSDRAEYARYSQSMQDPGRRQETNAGRKAWQDTAKLLLDVSGMVPAAEKALHNVADRSEVETSRARIAETLNRTLSALPVSLANHVRPLLEDQTQAAAVARLWETEIAQALEDVAARLEREI